MTEATETALETICGGLLFCIAVSVLLFLSTEIRKAAKQVQYRQDYLILTERS